MTFYFLRHAKTDAHVNQVICGGGWDIPLNTEGIEQAKQAAIRYTEELYEIRTICCSPLSRAKQTAEIFSEQLNVPVIALESLREQYLGSWEQAPSKNVPDFFAGNVDPPGGEATKVFQSRIEQGMEEIFTLKAPVLIVSHGAVWYRLLSILKVDRQHPGSCKLFKFQEMGGFFRLKEF